MILTPSAVRCNSIPAGEPSPREPLADGLPATGHWLPFAHLNLRCNPFGELSPADRASTAVVEIACWVPWLAVDRRALQFVGECGRGKTTHLLALRPRLPQAAYVYLPEEGGCPPIPQGRPLMIDEAQRLPGRIRRRLLASGAPLVLGTHVELSRPLRHWGYQVHTVHVAAGLNAQRLTAILNRRIEAARLAVGPVPELRPADADVLLARWGNDIRSIEGFLYERMQQHAGGHRGEVRFID